VKSRLSSRTLDIALKVVGVLVVVALVYLGYTIWSTQRANEQSKLTTRAVDALIAEVEKNPKDPAARILLAEALAAAGRTNEAITQYQNALTLDKNNVAALQGLGLIAMSRQDWKTAEGYWRRIIDELSSGQYAGVDERLEQADYYLASPRRSLHDYEEAVRYLKEALRIRRDASDTHYALAVAYKELGSKENQRKELETALAFDPLMPEANYEMALLLLEDGDEAGAAELLRRSVDNAPGRAEPLAELEKLGPLRSVSQPPRSCSPPTRRRRSSRRAWPWRLNRRTSRPHGSSRGCWTRSASPKTPLPHGNGWSVWLRTIPRPRRPLNDSARSRKATPPWSVMSERSEDS